MVNLKDIIIIDGLIFSINLVLSILIIILERRNPTAALAWLFFLVLFPGVGIFFYLLLAQNISKRKIFKYTKKEEEIYIGYLQMQKKLFEKRNFTFNDPLMEKYNNLILFHNKLSESFYSQNNIIEIYTDGNAKFDALFKAIRNAKNYIQVQYYIFKNDELGSQFIHLLAQKAKEGIKIRLLIDHLGGRTLNKKSYKPLIDAGGEVAFFFPSKLRYINLKANYRNHRKLVIIDGDTGFVGGFNVGREYINLKKRFGFWRDTHLMIKGSAVVGLQIRFILDWRNASKKNVKIDHQYERYLKDNYGYGDAGIQIVSSGPDSINEQIKQGFLKMISMAKKSIFIQTPYFIPDESIMEALKIAAVSGIDVKIMIPNKPDHIFIYWATYSYVGQLLQYGAKIYIYDKGFLHAKTICIDGEIASVGTCNFDIRSFKLNFEVNAFIYDSSTTKRLESIFKDDLLDCYELTLEKYKQRSKIIQVKESISRLFSPIL